MKSIHVLTMAFGLAALLGFSAEYDNNIIYRNGEKMRIISKIGVNVLLQGANADFEIYNTYAGSNLVFKVDKRAVGLDVLEVKGESVSNLVAQIAEEMARRHCATVCQARMAALEASLAILTQKVAELQVTVAALQERVNQGVAHGLSFAAKDTAGGTNVVMRTIRRHDGSLANAEERLLPGTYHYVWDAAADLPVGWKCDSMVITCTARE